MYHRKNLPFFKTSNISTKLKFVMNKILLVLEKEKEKRKRQEKEIEVKEAHQGTNGVAKLGNCQCVPLERF